MEERQSSSEKTHDGQDLPGAVSNQNAEEAESGHGSNADAHRHAPRPDDGDPGAAGEGSQSTGHPDNAG
jgi:hypothetical protein